MSGTTVVAVVGLSPVLTGACIPPRNGCPLKLRKPSGTPMFGKNVPPPKGRKPNERNPRGVPMFGKNVPVTLVAAGGCWAALGVMPVIVSAPASANPASHRALIVILLMSTVCPPSSGPSIDGPVTSFSFLGFACATFFPSISRTETRTDGSLRWCDRRGRRVPGVREGFALRASVVRESFSGSGGRRSHRRARSC